MNGQNISEMEQNNKTAKACYSVIDIVLVICYLVEVLKGDRTVGYYVVFCLLALIPLGIVYYLYGQDKESDLIRYVIAVGYLVFYTFVVVTTYSKVAYTYAIVLAVVLVVYSDLKFTIAYCVGMIAINVVHIAAMGIGGKIASTDMADTEIRLATVLLVAIFMVVSSNTAQKNNQKKLNTISEEKEHTANLMDELLNTSKSITSNIGMVSDKMDVLENTAARTKSSMEEVTQGTNDTAKSIQLQMEKTEQIQETIEKVTKVSSMMEKNLESTKRELEQAQNNIDSLIEHVNVSNQENAHVSEELSELNEYTSQMQSIIQMIDEITTQTSLLSLNASIEAARAGEAGKGFAVVASEISTLATQTQAATDNITVLIGNISGELAKVVKVVENMIENSNAQNSAANSTAASFREITVSADEVYTEAGSLKELVIELSNANQAIVEGIETISAATEEVMAHSNETFESSEENSQITNEVGDIIDELQDMAQKLGAMM